MTGRNAALLALALALALGGCKKRRDPDAEAKKVTTSSTYDATEPLVDEDYRFRLDWPGRGWKVLREDDARRINKDAVAGLQSDDTNLFVIVESAPGAELADFAALIVDNMAMEDKQAEQEPARVGDTPAIRIDVSGKLNDTPFRCRGLVLLHQDHAYQVLAFAAGRGDRARLDQALDAFSLVPGQVRRRTVSAAVADQLGIGWHIAGGTFASAASRLRVRPPDGWRLAVGFELANMNPSAEVGMVGTEVDVYLAVITEPVPGLDRDAYAAARRAEAFGEATPIDPMKATVLGRPIELHRVRSEQGMVLELVHGVVYDRERAYQVMGWYSAALRERAEPALAAGLAAIELLDDAGVAAVDAALAAAPDRQNEIGAGYALRAGTYHDFTHHLRWKKPPGYWRITVGQAARAGNPDAQLSAEEVRTGLNAQLILEPAEGWDAAGYHQAIVGALVGNGLVRRRDGEGMIAGAPATFTELDLPTGGVTLRYRVTTAIVGDVAVQAIAWSVDSTWPGDEVVAAIAAGLERAPEPEVDAGPPFRDRRFGFEVAMPPGWIHSDQTPEVMGALGSIQQWKSGRGMVLVMAVFAVDQQDDTWMLDLLEQKMREAGARMQSESPRTRTGELGGRPARVVTWEDDAEIWLTSRETTYYGVIVVDPGRTGKTAGIAVESFSLLD
jgi:hypothetical protein